MDTLVEAPVITQPLNFKKVQSFIREIEVPFTNALKEYADAEKKGVGYEKFSNDTKSEKIFTSAGLCAVASVSLYKAMQQQFGENSRIKIVSSGSKTYNYKDEQFEEESFPDNIFFHVRIVFRGDDGKDYFIDPTYGQINSHLNRIVLDSVENEDIYYAHEDSPANSEDVTGTFIKFYNAEVSKLSQLESSSHHQDLLKKLQAIPQSLDQKIEL